MNNEQSSSLKARGANGQRSWEKDSWKLVLMWLRYNVQVIDNRVMKNLPSLPPFLNDRIFSKLSYCARDLDITCVIKKSDKCNHLQGHQCSNVIVSIYDYGAGTKLRI